MVTQIAHRHLESCMHRPTNAPSSYTKTRSVWPTLLVSVVYRNQVGRVNNVNSIFCWCVASEERPVCDSKVALRFCRQLLVTLWRTIQRQQTHLWQRDLRPAARSRLLNWSVDSVRSLVPAIAEHWSCFTASICAVCTNSVKFLDIFTDVVASWVSKFCFFRLVLKCLLLVLLSLSS